MYTDERRRVSGGDRRLCDEHKIASWYAKNANLIRPHKPEAWQSPLISELFCFRVLRCDDDSDRRRGKSQAPREDRQPFESENQNKVNFLLGLPWATAINLWDGSRTRKLEMLLATAATTPASVCRDHLAVSHWDNHSKKDSLASSAGEPRLAHLDPN